MNSNSEIKTFIFDCFGVICDPVISNWYKEKSLKHDFVDNKLSEILRDFDLGILSEDDLFEYFSKYKGVELTRENIREEVDSYLRINIELVNIIKTLKNSGFKIVLLSNGNNSFFERKLFKVFPEFNELFDKLIISSNVGMVKPNSDIYLHTLEIANSQPEESLFIDDSKINIDAAVKLGINGFVYTDNTSFINFLKKLNIDFSI